ncbi:aspartate 1-decarboxylase, partial [Mesorhizobium sp. B2-3-3]
FETYTILGRPSANEVVFNGAAARLVETGDKVIIISYAQLTPDEVSDHKSRVVHVDDTNLITETALLST